jgi:hypothetical protein
MYNEYFLAKVKQEPISATLVAGIGRFSVEQKIDIG